MEEQKPKFTEERLNEAVVNIVTNRHRDYLRCEDDPSPTFSKQDLLDDLRKHGIINNENKFAETVDLAGKTMPAKKAFAKLYPEYGKLTEEYTDFMKQKFNVSRANKKLLNINLNESMKKNYDKLARWIFKGKKEWSDEEIAQAGIWLSHSVRNSDQKIASDSVKVMDRRELDTYDSDEEVIRKMTEDGDKIVRFRELDDDGGNLGVRYAVLTKKSKPKQGTHVTFSITDRYGYRAKTELAYGNLTKTIGYQRICEDLQKNGATDETLREAKILMRSDGFEMQPTGPEKSTAALQLKGYLQGIENVKTQMDRVKQARHGYDRLYEAKQSVTKKTKQAMETSPLNKYFKEVEFDDTAMKERNVIPSIEKNAEDLFKVLPETETKPTFRVRKLKGLNMNGAYNPLLNTMLVDYRGEGPQSFVHEYGHYLDYKYKTDSTKPWSESEKFTEIVREFRENLSKVMEKDPIMKIFKPNVDYYGKPTEVFARGFEMYCNHIGVETRLMKDDDRYRSNEYQAFTPDLQTKIYGYFDEKFPDMSRKAEAVYHPERAEAKKTEMKLAAERIPKREFKPIREAEQLDLFDAAEFTAAPVRKKRTGRNRQMRHGQEMD